MKLNTIEKLYNAIKYEKPEIILSEETILKAKLPIIRMLDISKKTGII
jgi:quinolinate synthase